MALFPRRKTRSRGNAAGGSAGNSSSNNKPVSGDGYKEGMLGWRSSRQAGGMTMGQKIVDRPEPTDKSGPGEGGCAWDKSMEDAMTDKGKPTRPWKVGM